MKKITTTFECDKCSKSIQTTDEFPYNKDWVYLYNFNMQKSSKIDVNPLRIEQKDKHFCSEKCLTEFITLTLKSNKY